MKTRFAVCMGLSSMLVLAQAVVPSSFALSTEPTPAKGLAYTIRLKGETRDSYGTVRHTQDITLAVASDGKFHALRKFSPSHQLEQIGLPGKGLFNIDKERKALIHRGDFTGKDRKRTFAQAQPTSEFIVGYRVNVVHQSTGAAQIDLYVAPDLNNEILRSVVHQGNVTYTTEATDISVGEPDAELDRKSVVEGKSVSVGER